MRGLPGCNEEEAVEGFSEGGESCRDAKGELYSEVIEVVDKTSSSAG